MHKHLFFARSTVPTLLAAIFLLCCTHRLVASDDSQSPRGLVAKRVEEPPVVDGLVVDEVWSLVEPSANFIQQQPDENQPSTQRTEVRVVYDQHHLYLGVICFDTEPDKIVITQARRDGDLTNTDSIQIILDTFNDNQNAFLFGTNPLGMEYDGQIASEGRTGGNFARTGISFGGGGTQRGQTGGFNRNWDGDWTVRASVTERGWEAELAIPFRTLRYSGGEDQVWGINVMRNIRRRNEQAFLAPIPRAYDIYRVSLAADLTGMTPPPRRDLQAIPYAVAGVEKDYELESKDNLGTVGIDAKWGITANLTADFTVNTDFSQVEADEEQINLTRFSLFFPEKRSFFLENAANFQFGQPQQIDLFFSRRIGLSDSGDLIGILGGARLSGKVGSYQVGLLNMQTEKTVNDFTGELIAPANNYTVARVRKEVLGRSDVGGIFVQRLGTGSAAPPGDYNRSYGLDANIFLSENGKLFTFIAGSDSAGPLGSDYSGRALYDYRSNLWKLRAGYSQVGERFNPEVGFVPRVNYRLPEFRIEFNPQPESISWIRRFSPHAYVARHYGFDGELQSAHGHYDFLVDLENGGRMSFRLDRYSDRPVTRFVVYEDRDGRQVVIPPGLYTWNEWMAMVASDPSAPVFINASYGFGEFYDGNFKRINLDTGFRYGARFISTIGYIRNDIELPGGDFTTDLVRLKATYNFSTSTLIQALVQYNSQTELVSANIRFAWLNRSGTGLFVVYNEGRDIYVPGTAPLGRSFIVKYTHLFSF